ncbi:MAG: thermonuclease family protein [Methanomicrobiales archaeon]
MNKILIILFTLVVVVASAGCLNGDDQDSGNQYNIDNYTSNLQSNEDSKTITTQDNISSKEYDASGYCPYVVDGDTIDVDGVGRIRLVGVNTPERGEPGYLEAKEYVESMCQGKTVQLDIDDAKNYDKYGRTLAVVYVNNVNLNAELLKKGYAEIMYIPPSEFNPYTWN